MRKAKAWAAALLAATSMGAAGLAMSEPYLAVRQGLECINCHVNPTGGGLRNAFGSTFAQQLLPAKPATSPVMSGSISDLVRIGADVRANWSSTSTPNREDDSGFELDQARAYAEVTLIPERLVLYVDELLAPNSAQAREAYVRYGDATNGWYVKGGKFYLPFGWRLQDSTSLTRIASAISMGIPDEGVELGYEKGQWSAQLAVSNGARNSSENSGHQITAQAIWLQSPALRFGAAASAIDSDSALGDRTMGGLFAGLRTGPLAWLAEVDLVRDDGLPGGRRSGVAALAEVNWLMRQGHNLKLTAEHYDPDRDLDGDAQKRWSAVYELTPLPFVQLRAGYRRYDGIEQNDAQNRKFTFVELHGFF